MRDTLTTLGVSAVQNATSRIVEQAFLAKFPNHRKIVKTIGWVQRIAIASAMTYKLSSPHYRQAGINAQQASELGFR